MSEEKLHARGTVVKFDYSGASPKILFRTLTKQVEWGWGAEKGAAYIFAMFEPAHFAPTAYKTSAESHVAALKAAGEEHVYASVYGRDAEEARRRNQRDATAVETVKQSAHEAGIAPEEAYENTRRLLGERD